MSARPPRPGMVLCHIKISRDGWIERQWRDPPRAEVRHDDRPQTRRGVMAEEPKAQASFL